MFLFILVNLKFLFTSLLGRKEKAHVVVHLQMFRIQGLGCQAKSSSCRLTPHISHVCHHLLSPERYISKELELEIERGLKLGPSPMGCSFPKQHISCYVKYLTLSVL